MFAGIPRLRYKIFADHCLGLLFHTTQSLILFAMQILFAMLRATSSFGLRPHSTQNPPE